MRKIIQTGSCKSHYILLIARQTQQKLKQTLPSEVQIDAFFQAARKRMEHPEEILEIAQTQQQLEKSWSTIFCTKPTYAEICDGTPRLTLLYRANRDLAGD